jgi:DHA2 family multidrug resistance protein-like MFS transporter
MSTVSNDVSPTARVSTVRKNWVLCVVSLTTFMVFVDANVVNTALPTIARDFAATNSTLQWVVNSYSLLVAGLLLIGGTTGDRFGRRKMLAFGVIIFGGGATGAALSSSTDVLIFARGLQGVGAAMMLPQTLSIITDVFDRHERAKAIAVWAAFSGIAAGFGPVLGGLLVDHIGWESVFWLHLPVVAAILIGLSIVPESRDSRHTPLDIPGAILGTGGILAVVYGIIQGPQSGWTSTEILSFFVLGGVLLAAFGIVEARSRHPMLPVRYLRQPDFIGPAMVVMVLVIAMSGIFFFTTQFLQLVQGRSALMAGVALAPIAGTMMLGAGIAMKAGRSAGPRTLSILGSLIVMGAIAVLTLIEVDGSYAVPIVSMAISGFGFGIVMPTATDTIMAAVPVDEAGRGSSMNDTSRELGFALGVAILGSIGTSIYRSKVTDDLAGVASSQVVRDVADSLGSLGQVTTLLPPEVASVVTSVANEAFVSAMRIGAFAAIGVVGLTIAIALLTMPKKMRARQAELDEDDAAPNGRPAVADEVVEPLG